MRRKELEGKEGLEAHLKRKERSGKEKKEKRIPSNPRQRRTEEKRAPLPGTPRSQGRRKTEKIIQRPLTKEGGGTIPASKRIKNKEPPCRQSTCDLRKNVLSFGSTK